MGAVLAKFRKEKTTADVLEGLEEKIAEIEKYALNTQEQKKRFVGNFLAISIGLYVVAFIIIYFVYFPSTWKKRFLYSVPLLLFPVVIIFLRRAFTWHFERKLNKNSKILSKLRTEKKNILEQVMDKETYKVAVNLLQRFGDKSNKHLFTTTPRTSLVTPQQSFNKHVATPVNSMTNLRAFTSTVSPRSSTALHRHGNTPIGGLALNKTALSPREPKTPRAVATTDLRKRTPFPIVNQQDKGVFERIVDVLIGDGPQDRFAMICKECFTHNGMALKEEFDYATFRCAFCNALNPSRKSRPVAPRLNMQIATPDMKSSQVNSSNSTSSDEQSDGGGTTSKLVVNLENLHRSKQEKKVATPTDASPALSGLSTLMEKLTTEQPQCEVVDPTKFNTPRPSASTNFEEAQKHLSAKVKALAEMLHKDFDNEINQQQNLLQQKENDKLKKEM